MQLRNFKNVYRIIALPLIFLAISASLWLIWKIFHLPSEQELLIIAKHYFDLYGYWVVFISAIIEGALFAGWYYPGSFVIFLGVIFAGKDLVQVVEVIILVTLGLCIAYLFNYALGKYGWYRFLLKFGLRESLENAQRRLTKYGLIAIFLSYWQPNLAALTSTAAGILQFSFRKFFLYSLIVVTVWDIFWGALVYFLGEAALAAVGMKFVIVFIIIWILYRLITKGIEKFRGNKSTL